MPFFFVIHVNHDNIMNKHECVFKFKPFIATPCHGKNIGVFCFVFRFVFFFGSFQYIIYFLLPRIAHIDDALNMEHAKEL